MNDSLQSANQQLDETVWQLPNPGSFSVEISVADELSSGERFLKKLPELGARARKDKQFRREMKWIAENRHKFAGRWIALEGDCILAEGLTSKEVFSKVANTAHPPLVIRIEDEELPFAGW